MIKPTTKQIFLLKITLGIMIASDASIIFSGRWGGAFTLSFFQFMYIVIVQWILLSDYLPKHWVTTGIMGCIIATFTVGAIDDYFTKQWFRLGVQEYYQEYIMVTSLLRGILMSFPQWFILKHRRGHLWILANSIGWTLSGLVVNLNIDLQVNYFVSALIWETRFIPLGILLSLYLYSYVYKPSDPEVT